MARYIEPDSDQSQIVVLNFADLYPPEHRLSRFLRLVRSLDFSAFDAGYENDGPSGGRPAIPVDRMLAVILYSLLYGNVSMRRLEADLGQRADLMFLAGGLRFDHSTISFFRRRHEQAIQALFTQAVFLGVEGGLIDFDALHRQNKN
jgi:transposase